MPKSRKDCSSPSSKEEMESGTDENYVPEKLSTSKKRKLQGDAMSEATSSIKATKPNDFNNDLNISIDKEFDMEISKFFHTLGSDMNKVRQAKAKKVEVTAGCINNKFSEILETFDSQLEQKTKLIETFNKKISHVLQQHEVSQKALKEQEEKIKMLLQAFLTYTRTVQEQQEQNLLKFKEISESFVKDLADTNTDMKVKLEANLKDLKKKMQNAQKNAIKKVQNNEMSNIRKSLKSIIW